MAYRVSCRHTLSGISNLFSRKNSVSSASKDPSPTFKVTHDPQASRHLRREDVSRWAKEEGGRTDPRGTRAPLAEICDAGIGSKGPEAWLGLILVI